MLDDSGESGMKIALQFSRSCARSRVPEVLIITLYISSASRSYTRPGDYIAITITTSILTIVTNVP